LPDGDPTSAVEADRPWPSQCCVPAFLAASIAALAPGEAPAIDDELRRELALILGVTMAPEDHNPWDLPISEEPRDWGVSATAVFERFPRVCERLAPARAFRFESAPLNEVPFEGYESAVVDRSGPDAIVGMSFDHAILQSEMGREGPRRRAHHVLRLSPVGEERGREPNVLSDEFQFDYPGMLWLFDDSGELVGEEALVRWRALVRAAYDIGGGLWVVRRADGGDGG
jgi:hypothetical protein